MCDRIKTVTIYGASSSLVNPVYTKAARQLGVLLGTHCINCITGGGNGLMGAVTEGVLSSGGKVTGIIPHFMIDKGWLCVGLTEVIPTQDMHTRKRKMAQESDACIALPGGIGTMEELLEIMTWKQLGLYNKPIFILNVNDYYDPFLNLLEKAIEEKFMDESNKEIWKVAESPEELMGLIHTSGCAGPVNKRMVTE